MRKVFLFCLLFPLVSCGESSQTEPRKREVKVAHARVVRQGHGRSYTFLSSPYRTTELSFRVGGPVTNFKVQSGQFFRKGQLIAAIDDRDFIIRKQRAEALYHQAKVDYERVTNLYEKGNISGTNYEKAKADYERAKADFHTAGNELSDTRLLAPFDGYVQQVHIDEYQDVSPSSPVVTFIDLSRIKAQAFIPEDMAVRLREGGRKDSSFVCFKATGERRYYPVESFVTQSTSENNISYLYTLVLDNKDNSLFGGMAGILSVQYPQPSISCSNVIIPQTAVCHNPEQGAYVWLVGEDNRVKRKSVQVGGLIAGSGVEVLSGLVSGDRVAVTCLSFLSDNEEVTFKL